MAEHYSVHRFDNSLCSTRIVKNSREIMRSTSNQFSIYTLWIYLISLVGKVSLFTATN